MPQQPSTLAQRVRAKHPGAYDDLTDPQLEAAVTKKYPGVYDDIPRTPQGTPPPAQSPRTWGDTAMDVGRGAMAGAASTVFHGGDVIRRGWNAVAPGERFDVERVIERPEVQAAMTPPESTAGRVGYGGERAAEYLVPAMRVGRAAAAAPWFARTMAQAGTAASVAAAQTSGDPASMVLAAGTGAIGDTGARVLGWGARAAGRAAAGAREGGVGGAIAATVRIVAPGEPRQLLMQALKPRSVKTNFPVSLDRALPELKAAEALLGAPIRNIDDLMQATTLAKRQLQNELSVIRGTAQGLEIDGTSIAAAMQRSIPKKLLLENPAAAQRLMDAADVYRQRFSLDDMETLLRETNADLEGFYAMYPTAQRKALLSNPAAAALNAQGQAMRQAIDTGLDRMADGGGTAAKELRRRYGALLDVEHEAFRRSNVAARQQPESLSEQIGAVRAAADMARGAWKLAHGNVIGAADIAAAQAGRAAAKSIKESQTTDALIRRAFEGFKGRRVPVPMPTPRPVAGLLGPGARQTPAAPDPSFVRGVPAVPAVGGRRALPLPARPMPAHDPSGVTAIPARPIVIRDPRTGRMRRIYSSEGDR